MTKRGVRENMRNTRGTLVRRCCRFPAAPQRDPMTTPRSLTKQIAIAQVGDLSNRTQQRRHAVNITRHSTKPLCPLTLLAQVVTNKCRPASVLDDEESDDVYAKGMEARLRDCYSCVPHIYTQRPFPSPCRLQGPTRIMKRSIDSCGTTRGARTRNTYLSTRSAGLRNSACGDGFCPHVA